MAKEWTPWRIGCRNWSGRDRF